jgi:hypothetical protein
MINVDPSSKLMVVDFPQPVFPKVIIRVSFVENYIIENFSIIYNI